MTKGTITTESGLRKALERQGYTLKKNTKMQKISPYHNGCYQIVDARFNEVEICENFELTFEDVLDFINAYKEKR